jgi:predicted nucleic acid-binding protein
VTLVDTNVLLDVVQDDPAWADWSQQQLDAASLLGPIRINAVIYSELSIAFARIEELESVVVDGGFEVEEIPREALFLAGKAFLSYRQRSRSAKKRSVLPDFFIGAHAAVRGYSILTRDVARYRTYFPTVNLISPKR